MPDPKMDIDYGRLSAELESTRPTPRPKGGYSVDDIRAALGRVAQVDDRDPADEPVEEEPVADQDPNFLDFADRWLAENPNATGDELIPTEVDRQLADQLPELDLTDYARERLSKLPPEIQQIIDQATHGDRRAQVEHDLPEDARAFEDSQIWDDIVRRVNESDQPSECPECGGDQPVVLGPLGQKLMVRCQHCGLDYSLDIPAAEDVQETEDLGLPPELESTAKDNSNRFIRIGKELEMPGPDAPQSEWYGMGRQLDGGEDVDRAVQLAMQLQSMPEDLGQRAPLVAEILEIIRRNGWPEDSYADVMRAARQMMEPQMDLVAALAIDRPLATGSQIRRAHHVRAQFEDDPFGDEISEEEIAELRRLEDEERQRRWQEQIEAMSPEEREFYDATGMTLEEARRQQEAEIEGERRNEQALFGPWDLGDEDREMEDRMGLESFEDAMARALGRRRPEASTSNRFIKLAQSGYRIVQVDDRQLVIERDGQLEVLSRTDQIAPGSVTVGGNTYASDRGTTRTADRGPSDMEEYISREPTSTLMAALERIDEILATRSDAALELARERVERILRGRANEPRPAVAMDARASADELIESLLRLLSPRRAKMRGRLRTMMPKHAPEAPAREPERPVLELIRERLESGRLDPHSKEQLPVQVRDLNSI